MLSFYQYFYLFRFVLFFPQHVEQTIHSYDRKVLSDVGGLWIVDLDMNSPKTVSRIVPEVGNAMKVETCDKLLYCGLPYLIPIRSMIRYVIFIISDYTLSWIFTFFSEWMVCVEFKTWKVLFAV